MGNRTGEIATWNKTLLQHEVRGIKSLDMGKFNFDFKSKALPYGAERLKTDRSYNLDICSRVDCGAEGFPELAGVDARPDGMMGFNYAKTATDAQKRGQACHFFIDDYQFERVWTSPRRYLPYLEGFDCVLTPDFSLYMDMPEPMMRWNRYRSAALGMFWQRSGLTVVPTLTWAQLETFRWCFDGYPTHSTVATSTVGVRRSVESMAVWREGMAEALRVLEPSRVLLYGGAVDGFDFGGCEVVEYANGVTDRMADGRSRG